MIELNTYLKTPTKCKTLIKIANKEDILSWQEVIESSTKKAIIGQTSNILFQQDFNGLVLQNAVMGKIEHYQEEEGVRLKVPAGMIWHKLVEYTVEHNLWGIENLALIPGLVGSAPVQNIGAYGVELSDCKPIIYGINLRTMKDEVFSTEECEFDYRESIFKQQMLDTFFIYAVSLRLKKMYQPQLDYKDLKNAFLGIKPTQWQIMQTICSIRNQKLPNPEHIPNLGSFFKNPIIDREQYSQLLSQESDWGDVPCYNVKNPSMVKLSAAFLIEKSGLKGYQHENGAEISNQHTLVLINPKQRDGKAVMELAEFVQGIIQQKYSIHLQPEVRFL